ncbi:membrane-spanning 4-domains subfamily A member 14 [Sturnira hondurensis]|uniref:membrane-spanning 4-domains subfamily A member 14 n=1 Tax=Sturnira hondurensis TaxID=192404 RepID=UPI00187928AA|nr:membrane-spanning 4-domains subfamily A member 14 [Sturnira hondurensis]
MGSSFEVKKSTHAITLQPNETILTAFPYGPHSSLLDFLKGEPRVLGAVQILLALIIVSIGTIFAFNYFSYSQRFPLVFFTGYPFWGALIFIITGYVTGFNRKEKCLGHDVMAMNVVSSLAAVAGIALTIISFQHQHQYCNSPSIEGICVIGRILFTGILSVLLVISLAELSISVTIASFRSKCWTRSNEIVFLLPLDVTRESELSIPDENGIIQMDIQEESNREDSPTNIQPVFFGGYTFYKLRVSRNPLTFHRPEKKGSNNYYKPSSSGSDEQQKNIPSPFSYYEEETEQKPLPPKSEKRPSEDDTHNEQMSDEDLQFAIEHPSERQTQMLQAEALSLQVFSPNSVKNLKALPPNHSPSQALSAQSLLFEVPTHHVTQSHDLISKNTPAQDMPSQDMLSQVQEPPIKAMQLETQTFHAVQALSEQQLEQQSLGLHLQSIQHLDQQVTHMSYQDIQSEVNLLSQEWKYEKHQSRKSIKRHSFDQHSKGWQSPAKKSLDSPIQAPQSPRRKSLDEHIKGWLSPKRHSIDKQVQDKQFSDQQAADWQAQEEKSPEQLDQHQDSQIQKYQDWQPLGQQSQEWSMQEWRNKECKAQECQFEMKHSLNWESQDWQTQDLLEKEFLKQKVLYKETHTLHAIPQQQSQNDKVPDSQYQDKNQQSLQSTGIPKEDMQLVPIQTKDLKLADMKTLCQKSSDIQSEDRKLDFHHASCQSSVQDASSTYSSNVGSEQDMQDVQQNASISSTLTACYTRDQQQSEDSD